jgi:hypothetical protein
MIPDRDIWRAANLLTREHGADAEMAAARADEMLERGDHDGQLVWLRIRRAIVELQAVPVGKPNLAGGHGSAVRSSRLINSKCRSPSGPRCCGGKLQRKVPLTP